MKSSPLIVALDQSRPEEAMALVDQLGELVDFYKVGGALYLKDGLRLMSFLKQKQKRVFLDLKFHDIPNTVGKACHQAADLGVDLLTIHLSGGSEMAMAAVKAVDGSTTKVLGVSVLTSMTESVLQNELGVRWTLAQQVQALVKLGLTSGLHGVVSSPEETLFLRQTFGKDFLIVNPGIRSGHDAMGDQKRTATPETAIKNGASYIVVGRPIIEAVDPVAATKAILSQIAQAVSAS